MDYRMLKMANLIGIVIILLLAACDDTSVLSDNDDAGQKVDLVEPDVSPEEEISILCYRYGFRFEECQEYKELG